MSTSFILRTSFLLIVFLAVLAQKDAPKQQEEQVDTNTQADIKTDQNPKPVNNALTEAHWPAFFASFTSIFIGEIGDKTFILAAMMAMKYDKTHVWVGSCAAIVVMTLISVIFGAVVPTLLPVTYTQFCAMIVFFFFGTKHLYDWKNYDEHKENEEYKSAEIEMQKLDEKIKSQRSQQDQELGSMPLVNKESKTPKKDVFNLWDWNGIAWQAFYLTFLNEWGDRSQFSTITLAAIHHPWLVFLGATLGHLADTTLAVISGQLIAEKISEKAVNLLAGILFYAFGFLQLELLIKGNN